MNRSLGTFVCFALILILAGSALAMQSAEIRLKDGSKWRGQVNDLVQLRYMQSGVEVPFEGKLLKIDELSIRVEGMVAGKLTAKTIFKPDIVSMNSTGTAAAEAPKAESDPAVETPGASPGPGLDAKQPPINPELGVFVLPMSGMVGEGFRHDEIEKIAKEADKHGPGQIIVLLIESGGGLGIEMEKIHYTVQEVRKRHRVVAWIKEAISAAAATASNCNEIYFTTTGTLGAMTGFAGGVSLKGEALRKWMDSAGRWMESGGRSKYIGWAMIDDVVELSYDKDPITGEVTWYNDLSGEFDLSDAKTNLVFTATTATHSKFADGIADTEEELATLLNLPRWHEKSDYGRRIAKEWMQTVDRANAEIPLLAARLDYKGRAKGTKAQLGQQIQIFKDLIQWWDRAPNVCFLTGVPPKEELERQVEELRRMLSKMKD